MMAGQTALVGCVIERPELTREDGNCQSCVPGTRTVKTGHEADKANRFGCRSSFALVHSRRATGPRPAPQRSAFWWAESIIESRFTSLSKQPTGDFAVRTCRRLLPVEGKRFKRASGSFQSLLAAPGDSTNEGG